MKNILKAQHYWNNKQFISELDKRSAECKGGKKECLSWQAAKSAIAKSVKRGVIYCHNHQN